MINVAIVTYSDRNNYFQDNFASVQILAVGKLPDIIDLLHE